MSSEVKKILELVQTRGITPAEGRRRMQEVRTTASGKSEAAGPETDGRIAVIGLSARYPGGATTDELWNTLVSSRCAVREVPADRWDAGQYFDADPATPGKTNCRWGGFVDGIDAFDPLLFNLSGRDAELMDPQQRLFLEGSWTALEDAGYAGAGVSGMNCGVFAGAPASSYATDAQRCGVDSDAQVLMGNDTAILASRISYLLNLRGPSIALNTACSSSLVAIDLACQSLLSGQCEMALAGGVCLFPDPGFYLSASKAEMLSADGLCRTFDEGANGFVPGEGVGVVVLKNLDAALRDGDHIRGVILGVATNQDGKTNGITAPSSRSQTDVQLSAYELAGINPDSISLIEAHGTGTALGDPIEVEALTRSFRKYTDRSQFCAIGSIKTNIGHTGQAAGVAGLIKALLSFEHELIPPTLHLERPNSRIDFERSPFYVATEPVAWPRQAETPRRAAVSSFGYSGTNAHLVVEEPPVQRSSRATSEPHLVVVSTKTSEALEARLRDLDTWLDGTGQGQSVADIAYTLYCGRKHFPWRAAFVAGTTVELQRSLRERLQEGVRRHDPLPLRERTETTDQLQRDLVNGAVEDRGSVLRRAAGLYEGGGDIDSKPLFPAGGRRIPMPTYPFARDRYWKRGEPARAAQEVPGTGIRLDDVSRDGESRFRFRPSGTEFFVADHVVQGRPILAAAASLELARAAGARAGYSPSPSIGRVRWHQPLPAAEPIDVLLRSTHEGLSFEIAPTGTAEPSVTGVLRSAPGAGEPGTMDLAGLRERCRHQMGREECYRFFRELGFAYGPAFQVVRRLSAGERDVLGELEIPAGLSGDMTGFALHPALLDGALQAMVALDRGQRPTRRLPYAVEEVRQHAPMPPSCLARVHQRDDGALDIDVADTEGRILVSLRGLEVREAGVSSEIMRLRPVWKENEPSDVRGIAPVPTLVLDLNAGAADRLRDRAPGTPFALAVPGPEFRDATGHFEIREESPEDYRRLFAALPWRPERILVLWNARETAVDGVPGQGRGLHTLLALSKALGEDRSSGPVTVRLVHPARGEESLPHLAALAGFARSVRQEDPDVRLQVVGLPGAPEEHADLVLSGFDGPAELRVTEDGAVLTRAFEEVVPGEAEPIRIRSGGTYLITGGAGAVGRHFAEHLVGHEANVVLVSRSAVDENDLARIGRNVVHLRADVSDRHALAEVLAEARSKFGPLHGIVHAAGATRDSFVRDKTIEETREVLGGKLDGAVWLDALTRQDPLDFLMFCSSAVTAVGNVGQADYAYANAFLDELAAVREARRRSGGRESRTISVCWPAWSGGGMASSLASTDSAIDAAEGRALFDEALAFEGPTLLVIKGNPARVRDELPWAGRGSTPTEPHTGGSGTSQAGQAELHAAAVSLLTRVLADELRVPVARIDVSEPLETYGIDSVMVMRLTRRLEETFGPLPKTLFFEYLTLTELAGYFARRHPGAFTPADEPSRADRREAIRPATAVELSDPGACSEDGSDDIAVVGVSGRYPMAGDLDAFWNNLAQGRDCITEIPSDRWSLDGFYAEQPTPGKSYSKWGGFLDGIDKFDPLFFSISPKEADLLDPQERLFLETVWHLLEDAGYTRAALAGPDTGVFVGVMYGHYQLYGPTEDGRVPVSSHASIANRVSYFFNFHGPSLALDTMCSSSLTAIHLACESLRRGECRTAVAGGVNLTPHPDKYLQLSLGGFASSDGRCRSFGADGDGYVPGEGVGALLLKPLAAAEADGDHIHAVIRGSALNHGGKTNGYTVPNPKAQADVVTQAIRRTGVELSDISYLEAHGTGTALGDPIEIAALNKVFGGSGSDERIPIGSVKSAIGHLESAAGIAAITKVILQIRERAIAPTLHADVLNPNIDFADSPFHVQRELGDWNPRSPRLPLTAGVSSFGAGGANAHVIVSEHVPDTLPEEPDTPQVMVVSARSESELRALAGRLAERIRLRRDSAQPGIDDGLEEELASRVAALLGVSTQDLDSAGSLSECGFDEVARAKLGTMLAEAYSLTADDLPAELDTVAALAGHVSEGLTAGNAEGTRTVHPVPGSFGDIAFTLQTGREAMPERLAFVASTADDAAEVLAEFATGAVREGVFTGATRDRDSGVPFDDQAGADYLTALVEQGASQRIAQLWVQGADFDWGALHTGRARRRVPLALYPFQRERHWLTGTARTQAAVADGGRPPAAAALVPPAEGKDITALVERELTRLAGDVIELAAHRIDPRSPLGDLGFDSLALKTLSDRIGDRFDAPITPAVFFERPGIAGVAQWLVAEHRDQVEAALNAASTSAPAAENSGGSTVVKEDDVSAMDADGLGDVGAEPIAVIGMSGRFPGARDLQGFWRHLVDRDDLVIEIPQERWDWRELDSEERPADQRSSFRWGAFLDGVDEFDPRFFGITPAEAEMMDPQQRLLLQAAWEAFEDSGYRPSTFAGDRVGLFAGLQFSDYQHLMHEAGMLNGQAALGNEHSIAVNRISYLMDFHGPSEPVNTACSSSLVAVHRAVRSLRSGESKIALAGGIALNLTSHSTVAAGMMGLLSPDGRCKTLDSGANGYVKGEGVGLLLLKPLNRAVADGDQIHAVIRGTSVNHGGRAASLTAPNSAAQAALMSTAWSEASIGPDEIDYIELHGTGTELGDPVEINGLKSAVRQSSSERGDGVPTDGSIGIGSVKTNVGHLEPASGIAGLIKMIFAMKHETLPGMVHLKEVNPYIDLTGSPFSIVEETVPWRHRTDAAGRAMPLRAGINAFGFGGVNAHVLIEEGPALHTAGTVPAGDRVFVFSAPNPDALSRVVERFADWLDGWHEEPGTYPGPDAVAYTLQEGREAFGERLAVVAPDLGALRERLKMLAEGAESGPGIHRGQADRSSGVCSEAAPAAAAGAWVTGEDVDWKAVRQAPGQRVSLPTYPFATESYWFTAPERTAPAGTTEQPAGEASLSGEELVRSVLREILKDKLKLGDDDLDVDCDLKDFGVDSMLSAMIVQVVQNEFDVQVSLTALVDYPTLRSLARYVYADCLDGKVPTRRGAIERTTDSAGDSDSHRLPPELLPINTEGTRQASFWVHGAAGYSTWFQNLSRALGPEYPIYAFQAKGTDGHSMPQLMDEMVDHYVDCIRRVQPEGPYVIGGYSFGGLVAMEVARRLHDEGEAIRHLIMFDTYPATQEVVDRHRAVFDENFLSFYLTNYFLNITENPDAVIRPSELEHVPSSLRVGELARLAKKRGQKRISADDIYLYLRGGLLCSEYAEGMYQTYEMRPYTASDVLFFRATDGFTGRASAAYWSSTRILDGYDYLEPWRDIVAGEFRAVDLDNDHLNMLEEPTLDQATRHVEAILKEPPPLDTERYQRFLKSFDAVSGFGYQLLAGRVRESAAVSDLGETLSREELRQRLEVQPGYDRLFHASLDVLEREGYVTEESGRLTFTRKFAKESIVPGSTESTDRSKALAASNPEAAEYLPLLTTSQEAVLDVMAGRRDATEVLFPGGSMELVAELYKGNIQTEYYNRLTADRVGEHIRHFLRRFSRARAQIFEVGAGTGGTSTFVFDAVQDFADRLRYFYTDIGSAFLQVAQQQFGSDHPYLEFATHDIEKAPEEQGFEPHSMDVVLASNVLHTTRTIANSLEQCQRLLKPGGILVINELTQRLDYNTLTFGLTPGWWLYEDDQERISGSPLLRPGEWTTSLHQAGFGEVEIHGVPGFEDEEQAQCMIVATLDGSGAR